MMQKVMIIGCCGAGKSTFAKRLSEKTKLPIIHLDKLYWLPNWTEPETENWENIVRKEVGKSNWIMDGNYGGTMDIRLKETDTIIFLDRSRWLCVYRILKRTIQSYKKTRIDMAEGCPERFDWEFLHYTFIFNTIRRPKLVKKLNSLSKDKTIVYLRNEQAINDYLKEL